jgi:hypothetical protein
MGNFDSVSFTDNKRARKMYVILVKSDTLGSKIISTWSGDAYTHSSMALDADLEELYTFNPGGFQTEALERYGLEAPYSLYEADISESEWRRATYLINKFKQKEGMFSYNFMGLVVAGLTGKDYKMDDAMYCSQFMREVMTEAGAGRLFGKKFGDGETAMRPYDFSKAPGFRFVRRGRISSLIAWRDAYARA